MAHRAPVPIVASILNEAIWNFFLGYGIPTGTKLRCVHICHGVTVGGMLWGKGVHVVMYIIHPH